MSSHGQRRTKAVAGLEVSIREIEKGENEPKPELITE
jgi:hypothetical protein